MRTGARAPFGKRPDRRRHAARRRMPPARDRSRSPSGSASRSSAPRTACIEIVVANMVRAIRTVSVERGHDPRSYCLLPFRRRRAVACERSGARARHYALPGAGRARHPVRARPDCLRPEGRHRTVGPHQAGGKAISAESRQVLESMMKDADRLVRAQSPSNRLIARFALSFDMRYVGQNFELAVPVGTAGRRQIARA